MTTPKTAANRGRNIDNWDAEDVVAWEAGGKHVARRNLAWSVFAEHVGFSVWSIWSVMVLFMPQDQFGIDPAEKFILIAVPTLVGAVLRIPYTVATAKFGGRNWAIFSAVGTVRGSARSARPWWTTGCSRAATRWRRPPPTSPASSV